MAASYPASVKTFASRSNGQTIDASHVNDLQDEVNAIEAGLLNGTAPLNSSNSTVNALTVSSAATINTLQVSSNSTIAGELFVTVPAPHARLASTAVTALTHNTRAYLNFTTQRSISTSAMHSTTTNSSRVNVVSTGVYVMTGHVEFAAFSSAGRRQVEIWLNDTTLLAVQQVPSLNTATAQQLSVMTVHRATSTGDYFGLAVLQDSGSTGSLSTNAQYGADFTVTKIR